MRESDFKPMARATLRWLTPEEGGRQTIPPGPLFAATANFDTGTRDLSIVMQYKTDAPTFGEDFDANIGFLVPGLAADDLKPGARFTLLEGPHTVAVGTVIALVN